MGGYGMFLMTGLGLFGTILTTRQGKPLTRKRILGVSALGLVLLVSLLALGCGSNSNNNKPVVSQVNVMVTGTSGAISHSDTVSVTIN